MDIELQRARLHAHLDYYRRVFPHRNAAYRRFKSRTIIPRIERALQKIEQGTYGVCDDCGETIPVARLELIPGALRCLSCQTSSERPTY